MKSIYLISVIALLIVPITHANLNEFLTVVGNTVRRNHQNCGFGSSFGDAYRLQQENEYFNRLYEAKVHRDRKPDAEQIHEHNNNYMAMNLKLLE